MAKYSRRKDGLYCYQYRIGYDKTGKRIMRTVYGRTVAELEAKIRDGKKAAENRIAGNVFVADYCRDFTRRAGRKTRGRCTTNASGTRSSRSSKNS